MGKKAKLSNYTTSQNISEHRFTAIFQQIGTQIIGLQFNKKTIPHYFAKYCFDF